MMNPEKNEYVLLEWVNVLYPIGGAGVPCPPLSAAVGPYIALSGHGCATSCLPVLSL